MKLRNPMQLGVPDVLKAYCIPVVVLIVGNVGRVVYLKK